MNEALHGNKGRQIMGKAFARFMSETKVQGKKTKDKMMDEQN